MNAPQRLFHLPFGITSKRPEQPQQHRGVPHSFFDGIRNLRTLKAVSGMCGSCK
jgi:hypothetical protein